MTTNSHFERLFLKPDAGAVFITEIKIQEKGLMFLSEQRYSKSSCLIADEISH